nr:hypothetical protein [Lactobacillus johnsonii]
MGMRLKSTKSKYSESFSIIDDYTHPETNKRSTFVVEALGSLNSLMEKYQTTDREVVVNHLKDYIEKRKQQLKAENGKVLIEVAQKDLIEKDETRIYKCWIFVYQGYSLFSRAKVYMSRNSNSIQNTI